MRIRWAACDSAALRKPTLRKPRQCHVFCSKSAPRLAKTRVRSPLEQGAQANTPSKLCAEPSLRTTTIGSPAAAWSARAAREKSDCTRSKRPNV